MTDPRIKVEDILEASKGMLQKQLYVVFTSPTKGLGPVMENIGPHLKYQVELEEKGIMFGAGPFWSDDEQTWEGEGMVIVRAASLAEAREIAARDPMHQGGRAQPLPLLFQATDHEADRRRPGRAVQGRSRCAR